MPISHGLLGESAAPEGRTDETGSVDEFCHQEPVRTIDGKRAAGITEIVLGIRFAALALGAADRAKAYALLFRLLNLLQGEPEFAGIAIQ